METIKDFITTERERKALQKELDPLESAVRKMVCEINNFNANLPYGLQYFISKKLWENIDPSVREKIEATRNEISRMLNNASSYHNIEKTAFDPIYDKWRLVTFEEDGDKIRFEVSCIRNEGSISGMFTFLDTYWTTWFDKSELDRI